MVSPRSDVIIVGGGIAGASAAYWLAGEGVSVALFEPHGIGSHASGYAFGTLPPSTFGDDYAAHFNCIAREQHVALHPALKEESGIDYHLVLKPYVELAFSEEHCSDIKERMARAVAATERDRLIWQDAGETRAMEPRLSSAVLGSCVYEGTFQLSTLEFTQALWAAAQRRGAALVPAGVRRVLMQGSAAVGVETVDGAQHHSRVVILANGAWITRFVDLPVAPMQGEILRYRSPQPPLREIYFSGANQYVASKADGTIFAGSTDRLADLDAQPTEEARRKIAAEVAAMLPYLEEAEMVQHTSCLRPTTPDRMPLVGMLPGYSGLAVAGGAGRNGILQSPVMCRGLSDLIVRGVTQIPMEALRPERFAQDGLVKLTG